MGVKAPEFWITTDGMREDGLPETFDYLRFEKGADVFPFICVHTDEVFLNMLSLDQIVWPDKMDTTATASKISSPLPGVYHMKKTEVPYEIRLDENGKELPPLTSKEILMEHLENMKNQELDYPNEEATFRRLISRNHLKNEELFVYKENLAFSVLDIVAKSNAAFPQNWNFNSIPGPLKSFCSGNGGLNEILGVSTAMLYGGKIGTFSSWHVEDVDYSSANIMFPWSAGKAWIGINPEDQWKLDEYISKKFRTRCPSPMLHKDLLLDIDLLEELGIRWYYFIQRPGDIIITNPAAPHQIVNLGYNLNEATNFYTFRHLVTARRRVACGCPSRLNRYVDEVGAWKRLATFVYSGEFKFLCNANGIPLPSPDQILTQLVNEFEEFNASCSEETLASQNADPNAILTIADALKTFSQQHGLLEKEDDENYPEASSAAIECEITETAPLDLSSFLATPPPPAIQSRPPSPESQVIDEQPPSTPIASCHSGDDADLQVIPQPPEPSRSRTPRTRTPPPDVPGSPVLFESPQRSPPSPPRGKKRPAAQLFEDPSQKARRLNARADFFSQMNWNGNRPPSESATVSSLESSVEPPETNAASSNPPQSSRRTDPRVVQTERILRNSNTTASYKESRDKARDAFNKKKGKGPRPNAAASSWFKDYMQRATRQIENANKNIARYGSERRRSNACDWNTKLQDALSMKKHIERRRLLHNVLQTMYRYCPEDLQERLEEGYLEQEIFRDFVYFHSEENMRLLRASLAAHNADFGYWENVLTNEEAWNAEFGVDNKYRIPCIEFNKLKFDVLDLL